jgi:hypothetical protein
MKLANLHIHSLDEDSTAWRSLNLFFLSFYLRGISLLDFTYLTRLVIVDDSGNLQKTQVKHIIKKLQHKTFNILYLRLNLVGSKYLLPILPNDVPEDSIKAKK